jgi:hypothetical protein
MKQKEKNNNSSFGILLFSCSLFNYDLDLSYLYYR